MKVIENNLDIPKDAIFNLSILHDNDLVGNLTVYKHPHDERGGQVHIDILPEWRCRWLSRSLKNEIMTNLKTLAKEYRLTILYSTALASVSPRLLDFAGFLEYYIKKPKTYYYLMI